MELSTLLSVENCHNTQKSRIDKCDNGHLNLYNQYRRNRILIMPPTLKKWGHIGFVLSVCMYVCMYVFMFEISS